MKDLCIHVNYSNSYLSLTQSFN